jgi:hypothetical protein
MTYYIYGSGMGGYLYDYGPNLAETVEDAIEGLMTLFEDQLTEEEAQDMRASLEADGNYWFSDPASVGAQYAEITAQDGPMPEELE